MECGSFRQISVFNVDYRLLTQPITLHYILDLFSKTQLLKLYRHYMTILLLGLKSMDIYQIVLPQKGARDRVVHGHRYSLHYIWNH